MKKIIPTLLISVLSAESDISEKEIILMALNNNKEIQLLECDRLEDSLGLELEKCGWIPKINMQFVPSITHPSQTENFSLIGTDSFNSNTGYYLNAETNLLQVLPGGAVLKSQISASSPISKPFQLYNKSGHLSLSISQPFLKNSFAFSNPSFQISLKKIDNTVVSLERKKSLLNQISTIRTLFWDYYEQKLNTNIYNQQLQSAQLNFLNEKSRFNVGESSSLDTLNALIKVMSVKQSILESQINSENTLNKLAATLSTTPDSLNIQDSIDLSIPPLPEPSVLTSLIESYDPSLKIFEVMAEKISLQSKKLLNSRYPELNLSATLNRFLVSNQNYSDLKKSNAVIECILTYSFPSKETTILQKSLKNQNQKDRLLEKKYREELSIKLRSLQHSWNQELQKIALAEKISELAEQQFLIAQKSYDLGTIERIILVDALNSATESKLEMIRLKISLKRLQIIIDEMTGTLFNRFNLSFE